MNRPLLLLLTLFLGLLPLTIIRVAEAGISGCSVSVNPNTVSPSSSVDIHFTVNNLDSSSIQWVNITSPSGNYTIIGGNGAGWSQVSNSSSDITYAGGSISGGQGGVVNVSVQTDSSQHGPESWTVQVSDDPGGASPTSCSGSLDTQISGQAPDTTPPNIYNIGVTPLTSTSVKITWLTDEGATSHIDYGPDTGYGETADNGALVTSHSVTLSGLQEDTGYHYQVSSSDGSGNTATSADNTFLTVEPPAQSGDSGQPITTKIPIKAVPTEKEPPTVQITTDVSKPFKQVPTIAGTATDNEALAGIEYSIDGGKDWLPVDTASGLGKKNSTFAFKPQNLKDGNYQLVIRAIDTSGNIGQTTPQTLIIDLLPPIVGGNVMYVGSQTLQPDNQGIINAIAGIDQKITMSAVGGPTSISLIATEPGKANELQTFSLVQSKDNGLWSGLLSFQKPGTYQLIAKAVDGAGNTTTRKLNTVQVSASGKITDGAGHEIAASVMVFYRDSETNQWVLWDGGAYDQDNPSSVGTKNTYGFYLPAGMYYLRVTAKDYRSMVTRSFTLSEPTAVAAPVTLHKKAGFDLGPLHVRIPWFTFGQSPLVVPAVASQNAAQSKLPNVPQFSLPKTNGQTMSSADLYGKPTVLSFVNTWTATGREQLAILANSGTPDLNFVTVASGESLAKLTAYNKLAGYANPIVVDQNDQLIPSFGITTLPTHYFLDRHGVVKKVMVGVLSNEELIKNVEL